MADEFSIDVIMKYGWDEVSANALVQSASKTNQQIQDDANKYANQEFEKRKERIDASYKHQLEIDKNMSARQLATLEQRRKDATENARTESDYLKKRFAKEMEAERENAKIQLQIIETKHKENTSRIEKEKVAEEARIADEKDAEAVLAQFKADADKKVHDARMRQMEQQEKARQDIMGQIGNEFQTGIRTETARVGLEGMGVPAKESGELASILSGATSNVDEVKVALDEINNQKIASLEEAKDKEFNLEKEANAELEKLIADKQAALDKANQERIDAIHEVANEENKAYDAMAKLQERALQENEEFNKTAPQRAREAADKKIAEEKRAAHEAQTAYRQQLTAYQQMAQKIAQGARMVAVASGAAFYGAVRLAQSYVQKMSEMGKSNDVTQRWTDAMKSMESSWLRIGGVIADKLLPWLEKGAELVSKLADYMEAHPELGNVAVGAGAVMGIATAVSGLGSIVNLILPLIKNLGVGAAASTAAKVGMYGVAEAGLGLGGSTAATGLMATIMPVVIALLPAIVAAVIGYFALKGLSKALGREEGSTTTAAKQTLAIGVAGFVKSMETLGIAEEGAAKKAFDATNAFTGLSAAVEKAGDAARTPMIGESMFGKSEQQVVQAYDSMMRDIVSMEKQYQEQVTSIIAQAKDQQLALEKNHARNVSSITKQYNDTVGDINKNYSEASAKLDSDYAEQRSKIVSDGHEAIQKAEQDHQERMKKLLDDHNERVDGLVRARDALGLIKEMRAFAKQKQEENNETAKQKAEIKKQMAEQLSELQKGYQEQKAELKKQRDEQLAEAKKQRDEALKAEQEQYDEQKKAQAEALAKQLRELELNLQKQIAARREAFSQMLIDLDRQKKMEQGVMDAAYANSLAAVTNWANGLGLAFQNLPNPNNPNAVATGATGGAAATGTAYTSYSGQTYTAGQYNAAAGTYTNANSTAITNNAVIDTVDNQTGNAVGGVFGYLTNAVNNSTAGRFINSLITGTRASGGYAAKGIYEMGEEGTEFVLTAKSTKAAEKLVNGNLSQQKILSLMSGGGKSVTLNDHRRFDSRLSMEDRRQIQRDTLELISSVVG